MTPPFWNTEQRPAGDPAVHEHVRSCGNTEYEPGIWRDRSSGSCAADPKVSQISPSEEKKKENLCFSVNTPT